MTTRRATAAYVLLTALAACGPARAAGPAVVPASPSAAQAATHNPSPTDTAAATPLLVTADYVSEDFSARTSRWQIRVFRTDGTQVAALIATEPGQPWPAATGGPHGAYFVENGHLVVLHPDSSTQVLGPLPQLTDDHSVPIVSPDGAEWLWVDHTVGTAPYTSSVWVGGVNMSPHLVLTHQDQTSYLEALDWTAAGPILYRGLQGVGGGTIFDDTYNRAGYRVDLATGHLVPLTGGLDCHLSDTTADGTTVCTDRNASTIDVVAPHGSVSRIPASNSQQSGDGKLSRDGTTLVYITWNGHYPGEGPGLAINVHWVDRATGSDHEGGPNGFVPFRMLEGSTVAGTVRWTAGAPLDHPETVIARSDGTSSVVGPGVLVGLIPMGS